jgi:hypothetical protein
VLIPNQLTFVPLPITHSITVAGTAQPAGAASCPLPLERSILSKVTVPKKRSAKATTPLTEVATSESGRGHRLRKAPATKEIVPLTELSRKTPEWLQLAYEFVTDKTAGPAWDRCVAAWFAFEGMFSTYDIASVSTIDTNHIQLSVLSQPF